jgi:hypothetical protein
VSSLTAERRWEVLACGYGALVAAVLGDFLAGLTSAMADRPLLLTPLEPAVLVDAASCSTSSSPAVPPCPASCRVWRPMPVLEPFADVSATPRASRVARSAACWRDPD